MDRLGELLIEIGKQVVPVLETILILLINIYDWKIRLTGINP